MILPGQERQYYIKKIIKIHDLNNQVGTEDWCNTKGCVLLKLTQLPVRPGKPVYPSAQIGACFCCVSTHCGLKRCLNELLFFQWVDGMVLLWSDQHLN